MNTRTLVQSVGLALCAPASAQMASLDPSFSGDGFDTLSTVGMVGYDSMNGLNDIALQDDGKVLVSGVIGMYEYTYITRYLANGEVDGTFADDGTYMLPFWGGIQFTVEDLEIQDDGRILAAGYAGLNNGIGVFRLMPDGQLDLTFANVGHVNQSFGGNQAADVDLSVRSDGHIVVTTRVTDGNTSGIAATVFTPTGTLDAAFDADGYMWYFDPFYDLSAHQFGLDGQDRIIIAGDRAPIGQSLNAMFVTCILTDGSIDTGFGSNGFTILTPAAYNGLANGSLYVEPDGALVIAGTGVMVRLLGDGTPDVTFGNDGVVNVPAHPMGVDSPRGLTRDLDGRYILSGVLFDSTPDAWQHMIVRRVDPDGSMDDTFGPSASFVWPSAFDGSNGDAVGFEDVVQPDGRILICGGYRPAGIVNPRALIMRLKFSDATGAQLLPSGPAVSARVTPSPAHGECTFRCALDEHLTCSLKVIDACGRTTMTVFTNEQHGPGVFQRTVDLSCLSPGVYRIQLESDRGRATAAVVKH